MSFASRHHPDIHSAASDWSESQKLHVAVCYSNPYRWRTRRELANDFRRHMAQSANVELHVGELAYGDRPFEITDPSVHPTDLQWRSRYELFHKENLLNLVIQRFPADWQYGAIIDADFHFTRHDWALETVHQLQRYDWVQLFSSYMNVAGETAPGAGHRPVGGTTDSFAYKFVTNGGQLPPGYETGWNEPPCSGGALPAVGAPGGAWAFRRASFDACGGLLDRCILGSGDWFMAFGLTALEDGELVDRKMGKKTAHYDADYMGWIRAWQRRAARAVRGNIGYVDQFAVHHFHGPMRNRGYATRDDILIKHGFSPSRDVFPDWQGVLELTNEKPRLRDAVRQYFVSRSEDEPHVEGQR